MTDGSKKNLFKASPKEFELLALEEVRKTFQSIDSVELKHRHKLVGTDGTFEFDGVVEFRIEQFKFLLLIECKHHKAKVKREDVQVLHDRMTQVSGQKAILFSSGGFQSGAVEYAKGKNIALVEIRDTQDVTVYTFASNNKEYQMPPYSCCLHWLDEEERFMSYWTRNVRHLLRQELGILE